MENFSEFFEILKKVMVLNRDNGEEFTDTGRLDAISELLWHTSYCRIDSNGLFHLYSKKPLRELPDNVIVVSSHVDCQKMITKCFVRDEGSYLCGTFDNALTNAAILYLMVNDTLLDDAVVAFTGDEEEDSRGALDVVEFFEKAEKQIAVVVLDVTDMGWETKCHFTIENNFWNRDIGKCVMNTVSLLNSPWKFVPSEVEHVPKYVPSEHVILEEAEADESWDYDEEETLCFSFCIPVKGEMHSNSGVLTRRESIFAYINALKEILTGLHLGTR